MEQIKRCKHCGRELPVSCFYHNGKKGYLRPECKDCKNKKEKERRAKDPEKYRAKGREAYYKNQEVEKAWMRARYKKLKEDYFSYYIENKKHDIKKRGIPWDLDRNYIEEIRTDTCPVFGVLLTKRTEDFSNNTAELDRLVPSKGYIKGNVRWISRRANRLKSDATIKELEAIIKYMKENGCEQ